MDEEKAASLEAAASNSDDYIVPDWHFLDDTRSPTNTYKFLTLEEIENLPNPTWQIDGIFPQNSNVIVVGPPGSLKSFTVMSMTYAIATGREWMGRTVEPGAVLYISSEGQGGLGKRFKALRKQFGIPKEEKIPFFFYPSSIDFGSKEDLDKLTRSLSPEYLNGVRVIVIDTMNRAMTGDENSAKDVGAFMKGIAEIQSAIGTTVITVHHTGKDAAKGARGSTAIKGAVDVEITVAIDEDDTLELTNTKQKEAEQFPTFYLNKVTVEVDNDFSLVLEENKEKRSKQKGRKAKEFTKAEAEVYEAIRTKEGLATQAAVIDASGLSKPTVSKALRKLEDGNYIFTKPNVGFCATYPDKVAPWLGFHG